MADQSNDTSQTQKTSRWKSRLKGAGESLMSSGRDEMESASDDRISPVSYRKGGRVKKTGMALLHRNERVIPAGKRKRVERMMKRSGMRVNGRSR
jgi:hypothetical protein